VLEDCCLKSIAQTGATAAVNNRELINQQTLSNDISIGSLPRVAGFKRFWLTYFEELFTNSFLHAQTPNNSLISRLRYAPLQNSGSKWQLIYEDNGVSLSNKDIDYLSKPFKTLKRVPLHSSNTGLGIAMLSRIVELHGGTLAVKPGENPEFTGLCITATLPVKMINTKSALL
jgi:signal transduction histidine kinase